MIDGGGTLTNAAQALVDHGAAEVSAYVTHGVLSGAAVGAGEQLDPQELVMTDSISPPDRAGGRRQDPLRELRSTDRRGDPPHRQRMRACRSFSTDAAKTARLIATATLAQKDFTVRAIISPRDAR